MEVTVEPPAPAAYSPAKIPLPLNLPGGMELSAPVGGVPEVAEGMKAPTDDSLQQARQLQQARGVELAKARIAEQQQRNGMAAPEPEVPYWQPCKSVEITLEDGRKLVMAPPDRIVEIIERQIMANWKLEDANLLGYYKGFVRAILYVRQIDGVEQFPPTNEIEFKTVCQKLGNEAIELIKEVFQECFPQNSAKAKAQIVKKY